MTHKQQLAINEVVENGENVSKVMNSAGYSPSTAHTPSKLTSSKSWSLLMNEQLPDDLLLNSLHEYIVNSPGNRRALLELAFKLKNKFKDVEKNDHIEFGRLVEMQRNKYFSD